MELKPCPFCGGEAHFVVSSDGYAIECDGELCLRNAMQEHPSEEYAALWWNTRAERTCRAIDETPDEYTSLWVCSECNKILDSYWSYCPNCGAKVVE